MSNGDHRPVPSTPRELLRATFDEVPELYDRARPGYPAELFDDLDALARFAPGARLVEIGCGTGQATAPLAERGYAITCVELGERMAAFARRKLARFPGVEVVNANFETWAPERASFDGVVAFSSFHWLSQERRYARAAELLGERGKLVVVSTAHVLTPDGDPFFIDVQADYEAVVPDDPNTKARVDGPPHPDAVGELSDGVIFRELEASRRFRSVGASRYLWDVTYTADDYVAVLSTYSGHLALDDDRRGRLLKRIHRRIESRPERTVQKTYLALLYVAERVFAPVREPSSGERW
jgi:SAM-dependent methyltransferase